MKKFFAYLLALCMVLGMLPATALAVGATEDYDAYVDANRNGAYDEGTETKYATLAEAIAAAQNVETVVLLRNVTTSTAIELTKNVAIDGNGFSLTSSAQQGIIVKNCSGIVVTITNMDITAGNNAIRVESTADGAQISISDSDLTGLSTVNVRAATAKVTIDGGTITCNDATNAENYGTLTIAYTATYASIVATDVTVAPQGDSLKGLITAEGGTVTINGSTADVVTHGGLIVYSASSAYTFDTLAEAVEYYADHPSGTVKPITDAYLTKDLVFPEGMPFEQGNKTIFLAAADATLTAPEGLTVEADVPGSTVPYYVTYSNGVYAPTPMYTISIDPNGGSYVDVNGYDMYTKDRLAEGTLTFATSLVTREGYTFKGWYDAAVGGDEITTETVFTSDDTIYAQWTQDVVEEDVAFIDTDKDGVQDQGETGYATLAAAIDAADSGDTVTLLKDVTTTAITVIDKAITLDGGNKTLTSTAGRAINVSGADGVKIQNLTINASGERAINIIQNATNVTIDTVTATAYNYTVNVASSAPGAVVAIMNSTLNGLCTVNVASAGADVTVSNSTINCNDNNETEGESYAALSLNKEAVGGKIIATNTTVNVTEGSDSTKGRNGAENGVVTINGSTEGVTTTVAVIIYGVSPYYHGFETLASAIEFAKAGDTVTLIRDVTENVTVNKNITLDLNGKTMTGTITLADAESTLTAVNGETAVNNLRVESGAEGYIVSYNAGTYSLVAGYTVTFAANSNVAAARFPNGAPFVEVEVAADQTVNDALPNDFYTPVCAGYTFGGWYTDQACTTSFNLDTVEADIVVHAKWTANKYDVSWVVGEETTTESVDYGTVITLPTAPEKVGHTFAAWEGYTEGMTVPVDGATFTAQWTVNQYTITFKSTSSTTYKTITQDYGTAVQAPSNPSRSGYTFKGWDTEIPSTMPAENVTITAQWNKNYVAPVTPSKPTTSTETTTNADGSTTTTVTNNKTGTVTETTENVDGSTTVTETKKDGTSTSTTTGSTTETGEDGSTTKTDSTVTESVAKDGTTTTTETKTETTEAADGSTTKTETKAETKTEADGTETKTETKTETTQNADGTTSTATTETKTETKTEEDGSVVSTETKTETTENADGTTSTATTETKTTSATTTDETTGATVTETKVETKVESEEKTVTSTATETKTEAADGTTETVKVEETVEQTADTTTKTTATTTATEEKTETVAVKEETVTKEDGTTETKTTTTTETALADGTTATATTDESGKTEAQVTLGEQAAASEEPVALPIPPVTSTTESEAASTVTVTTNSTENTKVEIPVAEVSTSTVAVIVNEDGTETVITETKMTEEGLVVDVPDGATVKIVDNSTKFDDVKHDDWEKDAVDFASARGLVKGVGNNQFDRESTATRAQVVTLLARLAGVDTEPGEGENWYDKAHDWAVANGITYEGSMNVAVSRQSMFTMMWLMSGAPKSDHDIGHFTDLDGLTAFAEPAARWAVEVGLVQGYGDGTMNPTGSVTRGELTQFLMNFIQKT